MASITIKAIPAPLHRTLKSRATRHQRSLNQEVISLLAEGVAPSRKVDVEAMIDQARAFRASLKLKTSPREIDVFKRQGRA